jgi:hypothetical protein
MITVRDSSLQDPKKSNNKQIETCKLQVGAEKTMGCQRDDLTLCSECQDEHCTPWQTQTARFLEVEQPEN